MNYSVAMTTYNGEVFLEEQLNSIMSQTVLPEEVVICDDCSTDGTVRILNDFKSRYSEILSVYVNEKNLGYIKNFERAILLCTSEYVALSDQDDIWVKNKIEVLFNTIGSAALIHSDAALIDSNGRILHPSFTKIANKMPNPGFLELFLRPSVTGCTMMFRREIITGVSFPVTIPHDYFISMLAAEKGIAYSSFPLVFYRQHSKNMIGGLKYLNRGLVYYLKELLLVKKRYKSFFIRYSSKISLLKGFFTGLVSSASIDSINQFENFLKNYKNGNAIDFTFYKQYSFYRNLTGKTSIIDCIGKTFALFNKGHRD